jgi:hypothetical protein
VTDALDQLAKTDTQVLFINGTLHEFLASATVTIGGNQVPATGSFLKEEPAMFVYGMSSAVLSRDELTKLDTLLNNGADLPNDCTKLQYPLFVSKLPVTDESLPWWYVSAGDLREFAEYINHKPGVSVGVGLSWIGSMLTSNFDSGGKWSATAGWAENATLGAVLRMKTRSDSSSVYSRLAYSRHVNLALRGHKIINRAQKFTADIAPGLKKAWPALASEAFSCMPNYVDLNQFAPGVAADGKRLDLRDAGTVTPVPLGKPIAIGDAITFPTATT